MEPLAWLGGLIVSFFQWALRSDRTRGSAKAFAYAIEVFALRKGGQQRGGHWVAAIDGVEVAMSVVASEQRGQTWFAEVRGEVVGSLGPELVLQHVWKGKQLPGGTVPNRQTRSFPVLDTAWTEIARHGTRVAIVSNGRQAVAWVDEPLTADDVGRVATAVVAIARWDAGFASFLDTLPDATPADDHDLSPAVRLAPDGVRIGLRGGAATVVQLADAGETVWPEIVRDRKRILAAVEELRSRRSGATGPYR
jgi:hypothetical protein